ncbi:MAG: holo-ACP synthase [Lentisphaerae bacterium]|nr:holo-ACP synthase [Lentisphaerota bacterium]
MIVGIGIDIIECERMRRSLEKYGQIFIDHFCTPDEQSQAPASESAKIIFYASRWAAKEACSKALGTGIGEHCAWKDIQIQKNESGRPKILLDGRAKITAEKLGVSAIHLSISHEEHYATAMVVAEK